MSAETFRSRNGLILRSVRRQRHRIVSATSDFCAIMDEFLAIQRSLISRVTLHSRRYKKKQAGSGAESEGGGASFHVPGLLRGLWIGQCE
jgi:hypothetical protein